MLGLKSVYSNILNVQKTDSEIDENNHKLQNIEEKTRFESIQREIERLTKTQAQMKEIQAKENLLLDKQNGELDILTQKIKSEEKKLFSGSITSPKELSAIQQEIASLNRKRDALETTVLEQMDKVAEVESKLANIDEELRQKTEKAEENKRVWQDKEAKLKQKISELEKKRQGQAKEVDPQLLEDYEDIRERKEGIGAGALVGDTCQVCHVALPAIDLERILSSKEEPDYCPNCRRILIKS